MRRTAPIVVALLAALLQPAPGAARAVPGPPPFRVLVVDHLSATELRALAARGAVGLLVPGVGPTTNRRQALAALVRGSVLNARLGGVPRGRVLLSASRATGTPSATGIIVVSLPPAGAPVANDRRYAIAVLGPGYEGLLRSPTTRIDGLVSIVDIAATALGRHRGALTSTPSADPVATLARLDRQIHANNRLKLPALIIIACAVGLLAIIRPRAAMTAVIASILVSVVLGALHVTSETWLVAVLLAVTVGGGVLLARVCSTEDRLLALILSVLSLLLLLLAKRPDWVAVSPLGPTQNSRFWGVGNQLETLLLAPLLSGAVLARRRFGPPGFAAFALLAIVLVTDNRFGSDGGGGIVLGVALAFLGARVLGLGTGGFTSLLLLAATAVLGLVSFDLGAPGPNHLRSAFGHGISGLVAVAENRVPLAYLPALHDWTLALPLALWFAATLILAIRAARRRVSRDLVLTAGVAIVTSLLVNDSVAYELVGGVAAIAALTPFTMSARTISLPHPEWVPLQASSLPNEAARD